VVVTKLSRIFLGGRRVKALSNHVAISITKKITCATLYLFLEPVTYMTGPNISIILNNEKREVQNALL